MNPVHFWEVFNPHPKFLCGRDPVQGVDRVAPLHRVTATTIAWFARLDRPCRNCLRVARARVSRPARGGSGRGR